MTHVACCSAPLDIHVLEDAIERPPPRALNFLAHAAERLPEEPPSKTSKVQHLADSSITPAMPFHRYGTLCVLASVTFSGSSSPLPREGRSHAVDGFNAERPLPVHHRVSKYSRLLGTNGGTMSSNILSIARKPSSGRVTTKPSYWGPRFGIEDPHSPLLTFRPRFGLRSGTSFRPRGSAHQAFRPRHPHSPPLRHTVGYRTCNSPRFTRQHVAHCAHLPTIAVPVLAHSDHGPNTCSQHATRTAHLHFLPPFAHG